MLGFGGGEVPQYWLTRFCFQRALGVIYLLGFLIAFNQFRALCGERGLLPVPLFLKRVSFWDAPSVFWLHYSDRLALALASLGILLSLAAISGLSDAYGAWVSVATWFPLWGLYLSFVNVGQTFYGFGWESLLLETGFLAIFLGPTRSPPPAVVIWLLRWVLFRVMFGAGLIKIRGDECWRDLTCMNYHYETQPMPNPLSWFFHRSPEWFHKLEVLFTHFVELLVPFLVFGPRPFRHFAGGVSALFQMILILSGNLSWLNYVTIVLCIPCFDDTAFSWLPLRAAAWAGGSAAGWPQPVIYALAAAVGLLSIRPALNLVSPGQIMNTSFEPLHLVNTYGAFGSITRTRQEVVMEGTEDAAEGPEAQWREYEFKGKPGDVSRMPPVISPYHLRLDWQMWFAAMSSYYQHPWILNLVAKLLQADPQTLALLRKDPFDGRKPRRVRATLYVYRYAEPGDPSGAWWKRERVGVYMPPLSLDHPAFRSILEQQGWLPE